MTPEQKARLRTELRAETRTWRQASMNALDLRPYAERLIFQYGEKGLSLRDLTEAACQLDDGRQVLSYETVRTIVKRNATAGNAGKGTT